MDEDIAAVEARAEALVESDIHLLRSLVALRKQHGLSQEVVAERMGVTQPTVASFERFDSNPKLATVRRYALAVGALVQHDIVDDCHPAVSDVVLVALESSLAKPTWNHGSSRSTRWRAGSRRLEFAR
ncbi:helix-turn-helix domain-containing protein [Leifsonia sp. LS-T14]|uniref:helix-turn-helix domain-containing protein n=1 Tax=unclassified Leifsonia TaxID=2663824 RepID=UPI0035A59943